MVGAVEHLRPHHTLELNASTRRVYPGVRLRDGWPGTGWQEWCCGAPSTTVRRQTRPRPDVPHMEGRYRSRTLRIDNDQSMDLLRSQGKNDEATRENAEMPDRLNTDTDQGQLAQVGIEAKDLMGGPGG